MNIINWVKSLWVKHGTKLLGFGGILLGTLSTLDAVTVNLVATALGPKWGPIVGRGLTILGGIMVARRGFMNSAANATKLPPPSPETLR